jgi:hypothetical protein
VKAIAQWLSLFYRLMTNPHGDEDIRRESQPAADKGDSDGKSEKNG